MTIDDSGPFCTQVGLNTFYWTNSIVNMSLLVLIMSKVVDGVAGGITLFFVSQLISL